TDFKPGKRRMVLVLKRVEGGPAPAKQPPPAAKAEAPKTDKERLQGTWVAVSMNVKNRDVPTEQASTFRVTVASDPTKTHTRLEDDEEIPYQLDPTRKPKTIDFLPRSGGRGLGIYAFKGDMLYLCLVDGGVPRPADFKPGEDRSVIVLKRA